MEKLKQKLAEINRLQDEINELEANYLRNTKLYSWIIGILLGVLISYMLY